MIEVQLPDGRTVQFPDGTPRDEMKAAMNKLVMRDRAQAAKAGTLEVSPESLARADAADSIAERQIRDPGLLKSAMVSAAQGTTLGFADEIAARLASASPSITYEQALETARNTLENARIARPKTALASELAGAISIPLGGLTSAGTLPVRMAKGGAAGGLLSGAYGFGAGEGGAGERMADAAKSGLLGGIIGMGIPVAGALVQRSLDNRALKKAVTAAAKGAPSTEQLRAQGQAAYKAVEDAGVVIDSSAARAMADDVTRRMTERGLDTGAMSLTPQATRVAKLVRNTAKSGDPLPFRELELLRRKAGVPAANLTNKLESGTGTEAIAAMDDFIKNLTPAQASGNADELPKLINDARSIWAKMSRSQMIDDAMDASENYLSGSASGIRNQFSRILKSPKLARGFSEAEKRAMRGVVNGTIPERIMNLASGGLAQIGTTLSGATIGSAGGPVGTVLGGLLGAAISAGARKGAEKITASGAERVRAMIANGGIPVIPKGSEIPRGLLELLTQRSTATMQQNKAQ